MFDKVYFEKILRSVFDEFVTPSELGEAMAYSLFAGGKRFRPMLLLNVFDGLASGASPARRWTAELFACALECIHTYSLIHDDLPCMDDDDFRRGKPTLHKVFGEAIAVLAGDALLNLAYEICIKALSADLSEEAMRAFAVIANASGASGMVLGQAYDVRNIDDDEFYDNYEFEGMHDNSLERLRNTNILKTSKLIIAAITSGAMLARVQQQKLLLANQLGESVGMIFQITDDLIDINSNLENSGKSTGRDRCLRKVTFPELVGMDRTTEYLREVQNQAFVLTQNLGLETVGAEINKLIGRMK